MDKKVSKSARYWRRRVISWERSAYYSDFEGWPGFWDSLSIAFRGKAMSDRMENALQIIKPFIKDKTVLDVGCASGKFAYKMIDHGAARVIGIDISDEVFIDRNINQVSFYADDLIYPQHPFPRVDLTTALGVIEYFDTKSMKRFLEHLKTKYIFFDFPDNERKKEFPTWMLRKIYTKIHNLPGIYHYSYPEFIKLIKPLGFKNVKLIKIGRFYYVTNLPI